MVRQTVLKYVAAINEHDPEALYDLMTEDYLFVDTYACEVRGRDHMKTSWSGYFEWFPDYRIEITDLFIDSDTVAVIGYASGTYHALETPDKANYWRLPAAWKVIVRSGKVQYWQVICDSKIPIDIMDQTDRMKVPDVNPKLKER